MDTINLQKSAMRDENLSLYEEFEYSPTDENALPSAQATPDQVRYFLTQLLVNKRGLPLDYVRRLVARWKIGTGLELRSYSPAMFLDIFGREDGWVIYREITLLLLDKERTFAQKYVVRV